MLDEYLEGVLATLEVNEVDKSDIDRSFGFLEGKLYEVFKNRLDAVKIFGSYDRNTNLSQRVDSESDVDVLVIFKTNDKQPDTFLKHLRNFADKRYSQSIVAGSHPAVVIQLNHTRFELVPAYYEDEGWLLWEDWKLKIPAPRSEELKWITTSPDRLKEELEEKDEQEDGNLKPVVRLIKYLNVLHGKPFPPFRLERKLTKIDYERTTIKDCLFEAIGALQLVSEKTVAQNEFVKILAKHSFNLKVLIKNDMSEYAIQELKKLFP